MQCLTITAVQRERDTQSLSVITAELEPVRAPSLIAFFHGHSACMCPFRWRYSRFSLKQQRILAHDPVNTFGIDRRHTIKFCLSAKQRPYPTITIRGQLSDNMVYTEKHIRIISVTTAAAIHPV
ncbi:transposase, partial [Shigella sonnei]